MLTFEGFMELVTNLGAGSKAMLRTLRREGPMSPVEFNTRAMFDVSMRDEGRTLETLMERGLVEKHTSRFGVELVRATQDAEEFVDSVDFYIFEEPDMSDVLRDGP